jgi:hypothetical protein
MHSRVPLKVVDSLRMAEPGVKIHCVGRQSHVSRQNLASAVEFWTQDKINIWRTFRGTTYLRTE